MTRNLVALCLLLVATNSPAADAIRWKKTVIDRVFRSEGVAVADVNKDGKLDIFVGDFWYEAPEWKVHPIRRTKEFESGAAAKGYFGDGLKSYSECMCCWADDVNGDGWVDQIVIGFPGKPAYWYENPKGSPGDWKQHTIWHSACNESPQYADLFGNGRRVLVMGWQPPGKEQLGQMAWFSPGKDPTQLWTVHAISSPSAPGNEIPGTQRFSHGLGVGDVNGDKRLDVLSTGGWWEQSTSAETSEVPWRFHPAQLGEACADMIAYPLSGGKQPDIITSSAHKFGMWSFLQKPGDKSPSFLKQELFPKLVSETHAMICIDIDGDGLNDLVTGKRWWSHGKSEPGSDGPAMIYWFKAKRGADGLIGFTPIPIDDDSGIGTQFVVTDFNGDGKLDVVTANKKGVFVLEQSSAK